MHHHLLRRVAASTTFALGLLAAALPATAVATDVVGPELEICADDQVTVVVDFTDLGGQVESGCATPGATGSEALVEAGFTDTRDDFTMICAINAQPDPCPAEFTGVYWSYWYAADGVWQSYLEGSDTVVTTAAGIEGWRYFDGSAGPQVTLPAATGDGPAAEETVEGPGAEETTEATADETVEATPISAPLEDDAGLSTAAVAGIVLAVLLAGAAAVIGLRRRHATLAGPDAEDPEA